MTVTKTSLGTFLLEQRRKAGLSQRDVSDALGITDKAVSKWETGATYPSMDALVRLAALYGVEPAHLLAGAETEPAHAPVICLTGGPGAGKTTALAYVQAALMQRGWQVLVVPETATALVEDGVSHDSCASEEAFQMHVAAVQQAREDACVRTAAEADAKCVVLCDRGIVDGAAFTNRVEWEHVLSSVEMTHQQALARYDAVLFLHTPEDAYTLDNNDARRESAADALKRDQQTLDAWRSHSHVKEIFGNQDFTKKMDDVVDHALSFLGEIPRVGRARTLLVRRPDIAQLTRQTRCTNVYVRTTFATTPDGVTHALVRSETDEEVLYEVRANGVRHRIGFAEYHALSAFADPNFKPVEETRLYFALAQGQNGQAALLEELRFYPFFPYQALLRAPEHADGKPAVPAFIQTIRDVSDNEVYTVRGFARALAQGRL